MRMKSKQIITAGVLALSIITLTACSSNNSSSSQSSANSAQNSSTIAKAESDNIKVVNNAKSQIQKGFDEYTKNMQLAAEKVKPFQTAEDFDNNIDLYESFGEWRGGLAYVENGKDTGYLLTDSDQYTAKLNHADPKWKEKETEIEEYRSDGVKKFISAWVTVIHRINPNNINPDTFRDPGHYEYSWTQKDFLNSSSLV